MNDKVHHLHKATPSKLREEAVLPNTEKQTESSKIKKKKQNRVVCSKQKKKVKPRERS